MKERELIDINQNDSKINLVEIHPKNLVIVFNEKSKNIMNKLQVKNLMDFPLIINVKSSNSQKVELKTKVLKINPLQTQNLEYTVFSDIKSQFTKNPKISLFLLFKNDIIDIKYPILLDYTKAYKADIHQTYLEENHFVHESIDKKPFESKSLLDNNYYKAKLLENSESTETRTKQRYNQFDFEKKITKLKKKSRFNSNKTSGIKDLTAEKFNFEILSFQAEHQHFSEKELIENIDKNETQRNKQDFEIEANRFTNSHDTDRDLDYQTKLEIENRNLLTMNSNLNEDNTILNNRIDKLIDKINEMGQIIDQYQYIMSNKMFSDLYIEYIIQDFTVNSQNNRESFEKKNNKFEEFFNYQSKCKEIGSLENSGVNQDVYSYQNNNFIRKYMEEKERNKFINTLVIEKALIYEIKSDDLTTRRNLELNKYNQIINLDSFNQSDYINHIKERFIELQYRNYEENKKKFESLINIFDNLLQYIVNFRENIKPISKNDNNDLKNSLLTENIKANKKYLNIKNIEELIKNLLGRLAYYNNIDEELFTDKEIIKLSFIRKELLVANPEYLTTLYSEVQNLALLGNEIENYKIDNKKLLLEYENMREKLENSDEIINQLISKIKISEEKSLYNNSKKRLGNLNNINPESYTENFVNLQNKCFTSENELNRLSQYIDEYKVNLMKTKDELIHKENEINNFKTQIKIKENIIGQLKISLTNNQKKDEKINHLKKLNYDLRLQLNEKENQVQLFHSKDLGKDNFIEELKKKIFTLQKDLQYSEENERKFKNDYCTLKSSYDSLIIQNQNQDNLDNHDPIIKRNLDSLIVLIVYGYAEILVKIYGLVEKHYSKLSKINQDTYFQKINTNKKYINELVCETINICSSKQIEEGLKMNNDRIFDFFKVIIERIN